MKNRFSRIALFSAFGLVLAAGLAWMQTSPQNPQTLNLIEPLSDAPFGGPFELVNGNGETVTDKDFDGRYRLMFFGFTYCPAVCPTELSRMTDVLNGLGEDADKIAPIFVSVDPERDTPEVVKDYVSNFHSNLIGLTGSRAQIDHILAGYKIYASKVEMEGMDGYMVDHSSFTYFIGPDGRLLALFKPQDTPEDIITSIQGWMDALKS